MALILQYQYNNCSISRLFAFYLNHEYINDSHSKDSFLNELSAFKPSFFWS